MTAYTRVTILGAGRRVDIVIPDAEPVAAMLPDILTLLEHDPGPVALTTRFGDQLDAALSIAEQDIPDGTPLWVTPLNQAPPPPQVVDITELTAEEHDTRIDSWNPTWTLVATSFAVVVLSWLATSAVTRETAAAVLVILTATACVLGRRRRVALAVMCVAAAIGTAFSLGIMLPIESPSLVVLACLALVCAVAGTVGAAGFGDRALGVAGLAGTALVFGLFGLVEIGATHVQAATVVTILGVLVLGLSPGIAMTTSGLAGLDDRLVDGGEALRSTAGRSVSAAYRSLTWLVVVCAIVVGICGIVIANATPWGQLLALATAVILALRVRMFPLVPARLALTVAAVTITVKLLLGLSPSWIAIACAAIVAVSIAAVSALKPAPVVVARLHRLSDFIETVAVVALVPLALAQWGVFADLIGAFR